MAGGNFHKRIRLRQKTSLGKQATDGKLIYGYIFIYYKEYIYTRIYIYTLKLVEQIR